MYRGTTPTLIFEIDSALSLADTKEIWVTLESLNHEVTFSKKEGRVVVETENNRVFVTLTQDETLAFREGKVKAQIRVLTDTDKSYATEIAELKMGDILKEGVIS